MGLSEAIGELFILLRIRDETSSGLKQAEGNLGKTGKAAQTAGKEAEVMGAKFGRAVTAIAAAAAGAIAAIELVTARSKGLNAGFDAIASSTGNQRDAVRGLANDLQGVTFGYDAILDTFQTIESHGVRNIATYKAVAQAADTLGASTRSSAAESADVILQIADAFDLSAEEAIAHIDEIAVANRQYGADLTEISKLVGTYGDEYDDLGLSVSDLIATYVSLRAEGRTHKDAMKEIGEATKDAADAEGVWADAMDDAASSQASLTAKIESGQEALAGIADKIQNSTRAIADYDKEIAKQEATVADLADALAQAETSTDIFADAYAGLTREAEGLVSSLESEQETLAGLTGSLDDAKAAHEDLLATYASAEQEIGRLEQAYEAAKNANDYFADAYAAAAGTLADANGAYADNIETLSDLQDAYDDLVGGQAKAATSLADLDAEYREAATSTDWLDEATRDHAAEIERLDDQYANLTRSVGDYQDRIEDSRHETGNLERDLARERETLGELQAEWDNLTGAKNSMGGALFVDPASMADLADKITASQDKVADYTWKIQENGEEQQNLAQDLADAQEQIAATAAAQVKAKNDTSWYTDAIAKQQETLQALGEKVATAAERLADFGDRLAGNRSAYADATTATGDLAKAVSDAQGDVDEFGDAVYGAPVKLTPYQDALQKTQQRAQDLGEQLTTARTRLGEIAGQLRSNEESQAGFEKKIGDSIGTLKEYDLKLTGTRLEMQKFEQAGLDYVKNTSPFEEAQTRQAEAVERARDAYSDSVDRLADLKQSRADEVSSLAKYREEYGKTELAVAGYRKELDLVNAAIATMNANPPNPQATLWAGLPDRGGQNLNQPGFAKTTGGTEDEKLNTNVEKGKSWLERVTYDVGTAIEPYVGILETGVLGLAGLGGLATAVSTAKGLLGLGGAAAAGAAPAAVVPVAEGVATGATGILGTIAGYLAPIAAVAGGGYAANKISKNYQQQLGSTYDTNPLAKALDITSWLGGNPVTEFAQFFKSLDEPKTVKVDTTVNPPSGDFDWIHFLSGGLIGETEKKTVSLGAEVQIDPTVVGGPELTAATDAEILAGIQNADTDQDVLENTTIQSILANPEWYLALEQQAGPGIQALKTWMFQQVNAAMSPVVVPYGAGDNSVPVGTYGNRPEGRTTGNAGTAGVEWLGGYGPTGYEGGYTSPDYNPDAYAGPTRQDMGGEPIFSGDPSNPTDVANYQQAYSRWLLGKGGTAASASPAATPSRDDVLAIEARLIQRTAAAPLVPERQPVTIEQMLGAWNSQAGGGGSVAGTQSIAINLQSDLPFVARQIASINADGRYRAGIRSHT